MPAARAAIPQPKPYEIPPLPPEIAARFPPPPWGRLAVTQVSAGPELELAVIYKRTYEFDASGVCRRADEQPPLVEDQLSHEPLEGEGLPSPKAVTEVIGFKTGTDVVVQGSAHAPRPIDSMTVAVQVGSHRHAATVFGQRFADTSGGRIVFTPPEPFVEMPLRYENAYGGRDLAAQARFVAEVQQASKPDDWRACHAVVKHMFKDINPFVYPRNLFGKGYVLDDRPESIQGRQLPTVELPNDLLTPERLVVRNSFRWAQQPIPAGFDFLDPCLFPRCAMLGVPPMSNDEDWTRYPEVGRGLIPADYCRGNLLTASPEQMGSLLHPCGSRCASLGLWLPFLKANEQIRLEGMDPTRANFTMALPGERPTFMLSGIGGKALTLDAELYLVHIVIPKRTVSLVWVGRSVLPRPLILDEARNLASGVRVELARN